jgi:hypothetical protein
LIAAGLSTKRKIASDVSMVQLQSKVERIANAGSYQNYQNGALRKKTDGVGRGECLGGEGSESVDV